MRRRVVERTACKGGEGISCKRRRCKLVVRQFGGEAIGREAPLAEHDGVGDGRGAVVIHQPGMGEPHAQGVVDDIADRRTIAGTGEAVRKAPVLERVGDGSLAGIDIREHRNRPFEAAAQTHSHISCCRDV